MRKTKNGDVDADVIDPPYQGFEVLDSVGTKG